MMVIGKIRESEKNEWMPTRVIASLIYNSNRGKNDPILSPERMIPTSYDNNESIQEYTESTEYKEKVARMKEIIKKHGNS